MAELTASAAEELLAASAAEALLAACTAGDAARVRDLLDAGAPAAAPEQATGEGG